MYASAAKDPAKALDAFRHALALLPPSQHAGMLPYIPVEYHRLLGLSGASTPGATTQTSASKG
jgi:hypothetical protein